MNLREAFDKVLVIDKFEIEEYSSKRYGFPESFGNATVCIHPNSSCREEVLSILSKIPAEWLEFEVIRDKQIDRYYMSSNAETDNLLFIHIGSSSGDTVLNLFSKVNHTEAKSFFSKLKKEHHTKTTVSL